MATAKPADPATSGNLLREGEAGSKDQPDPRLPKGGASRKEGRKSPDGGPARQNHLASASKPNAYALLTSRYEAPKRTLPGPHDRLGTSDRNSIPHLLSKKDIHGYANAPTKLLKDYSNSLFHIKSQKLKGNYSIVQPQFGRDHVGLEPLDLKESLPTTVPRSSKEPRVHAVNILKPLKDQSLRKR